MYGGTETLHAHAQKKGMRLMHSQGRIEASNHKIGLGVHLAGIFLPQPVLHANFQPYLLCGWKVSFHEALKKH